MQARSTQVEVAEDIDVVQSVINRLWQRFRDTGTPAEHSKETRNKCLTGLSYKNSG